MATRNNLRMWIIRPVFKWVWTIGFVLMAILHTININLP